MLDGVRSKHDAEIIWIVASNFNSETMQMDEAMLRRLQMKVDFRMPNREERLAIIVHYLSQRADKVLPDLAQYEGTVLKTSLSNKQEQELREALHKHAAAGQ